MECCLIGVGFIALGLYFMTKPRETIIYWVEYVEEE